MRQVFVLAVALAWAGPALATTFGSGSVDVGSSVTVGAATDTDVDGDTTASPGAISAGSNAVFADGGASASSFVNASALWSSADSGSIDIEWGWDIATRDAGGFTAVRTNLAAANWSYTFTASNNGVFSGAYTITTAGTPFGLQPLFGGGALGFGPYGGDVFNGAGAGTFSLALLAGQTYTVSLYNFGNLSIENGIDTFASADADIDWRITYTNVPEPATWAMLVGGFGLVGATARRRRVLAA